MIRLCGLMISLCTLVVVMRALAQEPTANDDLDLLKKPQQGQKSEEKPITFDPKKANGKEPDLDKIPNIEPLEPIAKPSQEDPEKLLARVQENMNASAERLEKKDVGDKTREIQKDILRDLDALINRAEENQSGGGKAKPSLGNGKSGGTQSQAQKQSGGKQQGKSTGQSTAANSGGKEQPSGGKKDGAGSQANGKKMGEGEPAGKKAGEGDPQQAKNGKGNGGGGNSPEKKEINTVADIFGKDVWGHLPAAKRMEMDAYSRERFMARYEDILREYYRTIAERNRRGGN